MIKKDFTTTDLDGNPFEETYYFNISRIELVRLLSEWGIKSDDEKEMAAFQRKLDDLVEARDVDAVMDWFDTILETAVGRRSSDGKRLVKSAQIWQEFKSSSAYSDLLIDLSQDSTLMGHFVDGILGNDVKAATGQ